MTRVRTQCTLGRLLALACICAALSAVANPAMATPLPVGGSVAADANPASPAAGTLTPPLDRTLNYTLKDSGGNTIGTGTVREELYSNDTSNGQTAGNITLAFQLTATSGTISQATMTVYTNFSTNVSVARAGNGGATDQNTYLLAANKFTADTPGGVVVGNVTRSGLGNAVSFGFNDGNFSAGTTSQVMIIRTNAVTFDSLGTVALVDGGSGNVIAWEPTPEPASLTMLGIGLIGMAGYGWHRRRQAAANG
jgi:hypothetical protein